MGLPLLLPAAGSFLAQTALGTGLTAGAVAIAPQLGNLMGGNVNWKLNPDSKSDDDRVIEIDSKGNKTFKPLDNNNVRALYGGWEGLRANAKERRERAERQRSLSQLEGRADRAENRQMLALQMQVDRMRADADLNRAQLELQGRQITQQGEIATRAANNDDARLKLEGDKMTTLAEQAELARRDGHVTQNNQIEATLYANRRDAADRAYEFDVNSYNQREGQRSAPGRTLMSLGAMLAGGRF